MATVQTRHPARRLSRGMSLIEILVGVVIGMLGILVIFQVLAVAEDRKRTTIHGSDAQSAGAIALYQLQRDVQLGGYGFGSAHTKQMGCLVRAYDALRSGAAGYPKDFTFRLYPVEIVQGAAGAPDTIRVLWGASDQFIATRAWTPSGAMKAMSGGRAGFDYGDLLVVTGDPGTTPGAETECALVQVTDRPDAQPNNIGFKTAYTISLPATALPEGVAAPPRFNKDATWPATAPFLAAAGFALNLGKEPHRLVWAACDAAAVADNTSPCFARPDLVNRLVVGETLFGSTTTRTAARPHYPAPDLAPTPAPRVSEAADGIINLQAEYGIDRNNNQVIDANEWTVAPPDNSLIPSDLNNPCSDNPSRSWRCVRAIRVALLARSAHWDKTACSPNPQRTSGAGGALALTNFAMTNLDGTAPGAAEAACTENPPSPNSWRRYRYSVYETVIPLRNMIWGTAP